MDAWAGLKVPVVVSVPVVGVVVSLHLPDPPFFDAVELCFFENFVNAHPAHGIVPAGFGDVDADRVLAAVGAGVGCLVRVKCGVSLASVVLVVPVHTFQYDK